MHQNSWEYKNRLPLLDSLWDLMVFSSYFSFQYFTYLKIVNLHHCFQFIFVADSKYFNHSPMNFLAYPFNHSIHVAECWNWIGVCCLMQIWNLYSQRDYSNLIYYLNFRNWIYWVWYSTAAQISNSDLIDSQLG